MLNFITLFDKNYLSRGLALYQSLAEHCDNFLLYILAMDSETEEYLKKESADNRSIISLSQIEAFYPELAEIKKERKRNEYCWTLTPYSIQYAIKYYNLESCTYIDADILFYNDPKVLIEEAGNNSVIITEHRYTPEYDQTKISGKYCVQFMYFRNDVNGKEALEWWRQRCKEWCYEIYEDGKLGDQKYLDDWITRFNGVYVPHNIGCGIAPWNMQQYDFYITDKSIIVSDKITKVKNELVFVHFQNLKKCFISEQITWYLGEYTISDTARNILYEPYIKRLDEIEKRLNSSLISPVNKKNKISHNNSFLLFFIKNIIKSFLIKRQYIAYKEITKLKKINQIISYTDS
jgi:hypothetical protein